MTSRIWPSGPCSNCGKTTHIGRVSTKCDWARYPEIRDWATTMGWNLDLDMARFFEWFVKNAKPKEQEEKGVKDG